MVEKTLTEMRKGGIYDHIGYGFHRYSTDREWLVPHFEKMLYDQAMLIMAYIEAYQATEKPEYRKTAEEIVTYVLRDLTSHEGGFYSAEDADSEGEEGKFYVWTTKELKNLLTEKEYNLVTKNYDLRSEGNYQEEATRKKSGKNILRLKDLDEKGIAEINDKLFEAREKRPRPMLDDKILTDWNGLMIAALSKAGKALQIKEFVEEAVRAAEFILGTMWDETKLLHRFREDEAEITGFLNDYAFMTWAMIELYQATFEERFLNIAVRINDAMMMKFSDPEGGFFFTSEDSEKLLTRRKELYDGAIPSGNSVAFYNLLRLSRLTGDTNLEDEALRLSKFFSSNILGSPHAYSMFMVGLDFAFGPSTEVVLTGDREEIDEINMILSKEYLPRTVTHIWDPELAEKIPYLKDIEPSVPPVIYVCHNYKCSLPTNKIEEALEMLK